MNKRILASLAVIFAVAAIATGATFGVFSSQAKKVNNTFSTGILQIRINGSSSVGGFTITNAVPGTCESGQFDVQNYGAPWFAGPSTLAAKQLVISAQKTVGDDVLWNALNVKIENCAGPCETAHDGMLNALFEKDLLMSWYAAGGLIPGNSETIKYNVCLPASAGNEVQGKTVTFDFVVDAYNPVRP